MNLPSDFIKEIGEYGAECFDGLFDALLTEASVSVRANRLKGVDVPLDAKKVKWCESGWYLPSRQAFTFDPSMHQGLYYVQDASSMILSHIVSQLTHNNSNPICYLDACAAPGGKTTTAIDVLPPHSLVVANEYVPNRALVLVENVIKWGTPTVVITKGDTVRYKKIKNFFDIIATDVPCSGEGMFRKDAEAVNQWSPSLVEECVARQKEIVHNLWSSLRPGGYLIYSTCTFNRYENEEMIDYIIDELGATSVKINMQPDWNIEHGVKTNNHCYRFMPHKVEGEGLFVAVLQKNGEEFSTSQRLSKDNRKKVSNNKSINVDSVRNWIKSENSDYEYSLERDCVMAFPSMWKNQLSILKLHLDVIHYGVNVANIKGRDFIPTQSLAMSQILNDNSFNCVEVDYSTAISYLRREAIVIDDAPKGYLLITHNHRPLGFVKNLGNRANNLYPQEWRILSSHIPETKPEVI